LSRNYLDMPSDSYISIHVFLSVGLTGETKAASFPPLNEPIVGTSLEREVGVREEDVRVDLTEKEEDRNGTSDLTIPKEQWH